MTSFQCASCGVMTFIEVKICDMCGLAFNVKTEISPRSALRQQRKMSFKEFEAAKVRLNKLKSEWFRDFDSQASEKTGFKKLETEIRSLQEYLQANIYLALLFQPDRQN